MQYLSASFCLLALATSAFAEPDASSANPLAKAVSLIEDLIAKTLKEGEAEDKAFKEYVEWCDDVTTDLGFTIKTLTSDKGKLEAAIDKSKSEIEEATSNIETLAGEIASQTAELKKATAIRKKENAEFVKGEAELVDSIDVLTRAIGIIGKEMAKNPAAFLQYNTKTMNGLVQALTSVVEAAGFSSTDRQSLLALVQKDDGEKEDEEEEEEVRGAPAAAVYKTHSTGIMDVLDNLKDKAEEELESLRKAENNSRHNYEMLKQSLTDSINYDTKDMNNNKANREASTEALAAATGDLKKTEKALAVAKSALAAAQASCMQTGADHDASVKSRAEELAALTQAKKILDASTGGAVEQTYSFVQIASKATGEDVVSIVTGLAKQHHSAALAQLASRISAVMKMGGDDPFAKVKGLIEALIARLEKEAQADATEKAFCDSEMAKTEAKQDDLEGKIAKLDAKIGKAVARVAQLKTEIAALNKDLARIAKEQAEMDRARADQNAAFVKAKAELEQGISGVQGAIAVLRDYYANNEETELLQQPAKPEFHKPKTGAGGGIIDILEVCESDFVKNLATEESQEADAVDAYEKNTQENKIMTTNFSQDVKYKTQETTQLKKAIADMSKDKATEAAELKAVNEYYEKLKDRCIAKPETYEQTKARREAEIAGLKRALEILESETAPTEFLQGGHHGFLAQVRSA